MTIDPIAYVRTILPALIGSLLTWAGVHIPAVTGWLDTISPDWRTFAYAIITAAVISAYYWIARQAGKKWAWVERIMLGSSKLPAYFGNGGPGSAAVITTINPAPGVSAADVAAQVTKTLEMVAPAAISADPPISADPVTVDEPKHLAE